MEPTLTHVEIDSKMKSYFKHNSSRLAYRGSVLGVICVIWFALTGCCTPIWPAMQVDFNGLGESEIGHFIKKEYPVLLVPNTVRELKEKILSKTHGKTTKTDLENTLGQMGMYCNIIKDVCIYSGSIRGVLLTPGKEGRPWQEQYVISINTGQGISSMTFNILKPEILKPTD